MADTPLLTARDVHVRIDDQILLPQTRLTVVGGTATAVRGQNGAGKTTLLRVLAGLMPPTAGEVLLRDRPLNPRHPKHRAAVAAMIGPPPLARDLTLSEQVRFIRASWGDGPADGRARADAALHELGIGDFGARYASELSSGQTQLFSLALTLARPCEVLVLDEPEQRLDAHRRSLVAAALRRRMQAGVGVVFATHSPALVDAVGAESITVGAQA